MYHLKSNKEGVDRGRIYTPDAAVIQLQFH